MRRITAVIPADLMRAAQLYTGAGVSATARQALQALADLHRLRENGKLDEDGDVTK